LQAHPAKSRAAGEEHQSAPALQAHPAKSRAAGEEHQSAPALQAHPAKSRAAGLSITVFIQRPTYGGISLYALIKRIGEFKIPASDPKNIEENFGGVYEAGLLVTNK
jgi:hypothetical protein